MRLLVRPVLAVTASLALTVPLMVASPAQAATYSPLSERSLANSSLGAGDVPRWMSRGTTPEPRQTFRRGSLATAPYLCLDDSGDLVEGKQPRQSMDSSVATGMNVEVVSGIYQYRTRAAAVRAMSQLSSRAAGCQGRIEVDLSGEGINTRTVVVTDVTNTRPLFGTPGVTLFVDLDVVIDAFDEEFAIRGDMYVSYYLAGTSIVSVAFSSSEGTRGVGRITRGFVDTMSIVIAQRVDRRSLG